MSGVQLSRLVRLGGPGHSSQTYIHIPGYFIVEGKDGLTYEYGRTGDSYIESLGQQSAARAWAVNKIKDRADNAILFTYAEDTTNGFYRIARIDYTANAAQGLSAAYVIGFFWQTKPSNQMDSGYIAGAKVKEVTRLDRIDVSHGTTLVRRYRPTYDAALSTTSRSRLASVQECAGPSLDCFAPTSFTYQNGAPGLNGETNTGSRMKSRYLAGCVLSIVGMLALSRTGVACDCVWSSLSARIEKADVVLLATVTGRKSSGFVELQPAEIFKGKITSTFTVKTGDSMCSVFHSSVDPKAGERYLLFLEKSKDYFVTGLCSGSGRFKWQQIQVELPELRKLHGLKGQPRALPEARATARAGEARVRC